MGRLTQVGIKLALKNVGRYRDGGGLMLVVSKPGRGSWVARFQRKGERRDYGLGSVKLVSLAEARDKARQIKIALLEGRDPHAINAPPPEMQRLFRETAMEFIDRKFSGPGHEQALARLKTYVFPSIGKLQLQSIDVRRIANCVEPIWLTKPETALRVRALIIRTLRYGRPDGPALAGTLARAVSDMLPAQIKSNEGLPSMPWLNLPEYMSRLVKGNAIQTGNANKGFNFLEIYRKFLTEGIDEQDARKKAASQVGITRQWANKLLKKAIT